MYLIKAIHNRNRITLEEGALRIPAFQSVWRAKAEWIWVSRLLYSSFSNTYFYFRVPCSPIRIREVYLTRPSVSLSSSSSHPKGTHDTWCGPLTQISRRFQTFEDCWCLEIRPMILFLCPFHRWPLIQWAFPSSFERSPAWLQRGRLDRGIIGQHWRLHPWLPRLHSLSVYTILSCCGVGDRHKVRAGLSTHSS